MNREDKKKLIKSSGNAPNGKLISYESLRHVICEERRMFTRSILPDEARKIIVQCKSQQVILFY